MSRPLLKTHSTSMDVAMSSDGQGFAKPQGYTGKGTAGKGQGRDN